MQMQKNLARFGAVLAVLLALLLAYALPVRAETYENVVTGLDRLQTLADQYAAQGADADPIDLVLTYVRPPRYNTTLWLMAGGVKDPDFEAYVAQNDPELAALQEAGSVSLPNGQNVDFSHFLASLQLVYKGLPVVGSWGGDCMEMVKAYRGQAADADGYTALMQTSFNAGGDSVFGNEDLRADLDSVILGAQLGPDTRLAELLRGYHTADLTDYTRAVQFTALTFGSINTGSESALRQTVYNTLVEDTGLQMLLYLNDLWERDSWQLAADADAPLHAIANLFADYLAASANYERVESTSDTRMTTQAAQALADMLTAMGDTDAASAALTALQNHTPQKPTADGVDGMLDDATQKIRDRFDVALFRAVLMVLLGAAAVGTFVCLGMAVRDFLRR